MHQTHFCKKGVIFWKFIYKSNIVLSCKFRNHCQTYAFFYEKQSEADKHNESLFNMDIYEVLIEAMCNIEAGTDADLRPFRCLWEHKKLMLERIKHLSFNEYSDC